MSGLIEQEALQGVVELAATGDEVAFARIVAAHHADMTRVSFVVCGDPDLAHEAVQSAWLIAWRKLRSLRDPDRLRSWLIAVAANEARQLIRRRSRRSVFEIPIDDGDPGQRGYRTGGYPGENAESLDLVAALRRLTPDDRTVVAMRYVAGLNSTEIGRAIGMSPPGVRAKLARLLDRLREDLDDE